MVLADTVMLIRSQTRKHTVAKVLMDQNFKVYGLPDQLHLDNGKEFVNNLWRELFSELKIQHTTTPPYNPASIEPS